MAVYLLITEILILHTMQKLATSVDTGVLKQFVLSIIDSITIINANISSIVFKNGLCHEFIFKQQKK